MPRPTSIASKTSSSVTPSSQAISAGVGRRAQPHLQGLLDAPGTQQALLEPARDLHLPGPVPEVVLDLAQNGGRGIGGEREGAVGVVAVHGADQADGADLDQILQRLRTRQEAGGQRPDELGVIGDHGIPHPHVRVRE